MAQFQNVMSGSNSDYHLVQFLIDIHMEEFGAIIAQHKQVTTQSLGQYERLIALYQHDYLDGKGYLWALPLQENYRDLFIIYALQLAEFYMQTGNDGQAIITLKKILEISPLEETAHKLLLELYFFHKDRVAFITHYTAMTTLLAEELGISPKDNMVAWYEEIRSL